MSEDVPTNKEINKNEPSRSKSVNAERTDSARGIAKTFIEEVNEGFLETLGEFAITVAHPIKMALGVSSQIEVAPGYGLCEFLGGFFRKSFREKVLEAVHAEMIAEYHEELASGNLVRAKRIRRMIPFWLLWSAIGGAIISLAGKFSFKVGGPRE